MKNYIILLGLVISYDVLMAQDNIVTYGIDETTLTRDYADIEKYKSEISSPFFLGWSLDGQSMLLNGGKVIYSMKAHNSAFETYKKSSFGFSSYLSPNHQYFLSQEDEGGNEDYQLYLHTIASDSKQTLTIKGDKSYDPYWSPDNDRFIYKSNKVNPAIVDLYIRGVDEPVDEHLVFQDFSDDGVIYDWDFDKHLILAVKVISENNKLLYLINDQTYEVQQINAGKVDIAYSAAKFIPQQNACLIVSDEFSEYLQLLHYDLDSRTFTNLTENIDWDIESVSIDAEGRQAAFSVNANGLSELYILDIASQKYSRVANFPEGIIRNLTINPKGTEVGFNFYASTFSRKVYGYDIQSGNLNQYRENGAPTTDSISFTKAESFTYKSVDPDTKERFDIPGFIYRSKKSSSAVLIDIHGGPEYQVRAYFNGFQQYMVNELGITVIVPNIRGSNGYGKSYMKMDDGFNRENAIEDIGALLDWIEKQDNLDASKVAIFGESYGGFVVLSSLVNYPDRIKCGIDGVGITDWITYLKNTRDYRRDLRRVEFGDERDPEMYAFLENISPYNNIDKITSPLLIFQGLNDPRVNYKGSEEVYKALSAKEKPVWYVLAKDEGHGFVKYSNYALQRNITVSFLKKYLSLE